MQRRENNYAFIDSQNLYKGIRDLGWQLDFKRFRVYLTHKYHVGKAFLFIGYLPQNTNLYRALQDYSYTLIFKPTIPDKDGKTKLFLLITSNKNSRTQKEKAPRKDVPDTKCLFVCICL